MFHNDFQDKAELEAIIARVEWTTLIFFATLFVVMEALNQLGLLEWIGDQVSSVIQMVDENYRQLYSSFLDNKSLASSFCSIATLPSWSASR